jgi:hypothetical protein
MRTLSMLNVFSAFMKILDINWTVFIIEDIHTSFSIQHSV